MYDQDQGHGWSLKYFQIYGSRKGSLYKKKFSKRFKKIPYNRMKKSSKRFLLFFTNMSLFFPEWILFFC